MEAPDVRAFTQIFAEASRPTIRTPRPKSSKEFAPTSFAPSSRRSAGGLRRLPRIDGPRNRTRDCRPLPEFDWTRHARGLAELWLAVERNFSTVQDQDPDPVSIVAQGNVVVIFGREKGRIRVTSNPMTCTSSIRSHFDGTRSGECSRSRRSSHLRREASAGRDTSVYDCGVDNGTTYIASERVSGETETVTANWTREGEQAAWRPCRSPIESAQP